MGRVAAWLGGIALVLFLIGPLLAHFELTGPAAGFYTFGIGVLLGVVTLILSVIALIRGPRESRRRAYAGLVASLAIVVTVIAIAQPNTNVPRINDITTDTENPPVFVFAKTLPDNASRDMTYPGEEVAEQQEEGYPDLAPLRLPIPPQQAFARVQLAARSMEGWEITHEDPQGLRLEGTDTSDLFRFVDDFVIEVREADGGSEVHMRSKSRVGRGDVGANAKRIETFFARLRSGSAAQ